MQSILNQKTNAFKTTKKIKKTFYIYSFSHATWLRSLQSLHISIYVHPV